MKKCYELAIYDNGCNVLKTYEFDTMEETQRELKNLVENREGFRFVELSLVYIEDDEQVASFRVADIDLLALEV